MRIIINLIKHRLLFELSLVKKATNWTRGILNRTDDGKYVFFLDYDITKQEYIEGEIKHIQERHNLGDILLFQSSPKSFHVVSFEKLIPKEFIEILINSSCDEVFKDIPRFTSYRNWVLRNFEKGNVPRPQLIKVFKRETDREKSLAHYMYFKALYPEIEIEGKYDKSEEVTIIEYPTAKV